MLNKKVKHITTKDILKARCMDTLENTKNNNLPTKYVKQRNATFVKKHWTV